MMRPIQQGLKESREESDARPMRSAERLDSMYGFLILNRDGLDCSVAQVDQEEMPRGLRENIHEMQDSRMLGDGEYDLIAKTEALLLTCVESCSEPV
jgi:hypothetical protein